MSKNISEKCGIVAIMDILGTRQIKEMDDARLYLNGVESFNFILDAIIQHLNSYENISCNEITATKQLDYEITISMFSDTVIITLSFEDQRKLASAFSIIGSIIMQFFFWGLKDRLLFRGVISFDRFFALKTSSYLMAGIPISETFTPTKKFLFVGPAIIESANYYEKSDWIGISTLPSATAKLDNVSNEQEVTKYFDKMELTKYGVNHDGWALIWPIYDTLQGSLNPTNESHIHYLEEQKEFYRENNKIFLKYENTIKFYNDVRKTASHA